MPSDVKWTINAADVTFSGTPYRAGTYNLRVVGKERITGQELFKDLVLTITLNLDVLGMSLNGSNAANVSCLPAGSNCGYYGNRQEIIKLNVTEPVAGWYPRDLNNVGAAMSSVTLAPGYSLPPGLKPALSADKKFIYFAGKATKAGTNEAALRVRTPSNYVFDTSTVTFVVTP